MRSNPVTTNIHEANTIIPALDALITQSEIRNDLTLPRVMIYQLSPLVEKKERRDATIMHIVVAIMLCAVGLLSGAVYLFMLYNDKKPFVYSYNDQLPFFVTAIAAAASGLAILLLSVFRRSWLRRQRNSATLHGIEILLMAGLAAGFALFNLMIPTALFAVMTLILGASILWERRHHRGPADIALSTEGIHLTGAKKVRNLPWWEVEKVLLRHGVLTIEATGNRLFQRHVEPVHFNAADFESWCAGLIDAQADKRRKADW